MAQSASTQSEHQVAAVPPPPLSSAPPPPASAVEPAPSAPIMPDLPPKTPALYANRFQGAEYKRNIWIANPEAGTPMAAILEPAYWAHCAEKMRPWDRIEVRYEDQTQRHFVELIVSAVGRGWARVVPLSRVDLGAKVGTSSLADFDIDFSASTQYRVIRRSDGQVLRDSLPDRRDAEQWIMNHVGSGRRV